MRRWPLNFPAYWVVENSAIEDFFAKFIWLIVPLQYGLLTQIARGLDPGDYTVAALLSLSSMVLLLIAGSATAGVVLVIFKRARGNYQQVARMWVVSLLISWAGANFLYAGSLICGYVWEWNGDLLGDSLRILMVDRLKILKEVDVVPGRNWPTFLSYLIFAYLSVAVCFLVRVLHIRFSRQRGPSPPLPEPDLIWPGVVVATVMMFINVVATAPAK
ncbi:hypothetical protein [Bradyrhizobium sp. AZCC 1693]|uniref:hypothetical protein n=1 Tax=Bradyrhizobium sp. AZCC 1693 TaxID=3117029 RepID=UPI002FF0AA99